MIVGTGRFTIPPVRLLRQPPHLRHGAQITNQHGLGAGTGLACGGGALAVARVQDDAVPVLDEGARGEGAEAVGGAGDEDPGH